jgi:hypothetical protein
VRRPRPPTIQPYPQPPRDPIREALNGRLDAEEWEELRAAAWEAWLELVTVEAEQRTDDHRDPARGPVRDWPPGGAALHDGVEGQALARWFDERSAIGPERQRAWAEQDLAELASFRERNPEAAEEIAEALAEYEHRLLAVRAEPQRRSLTPGQLPGDPAR